MTTATLCLRFIFVKSKQNCCPYPSCPRGHCKRRQISVRVRRRKLNLVCSENVTRKYNDHEHESFLKATMFKLSAYLFFNLFADWKEFASPCMPFGMRHWASKFGHSVVCYSVANTAILLYATRRPSRPCFHWWWSAYKAVLRHNIQNLFYHSLNPILSFHIHFHA